MSYYNTILQIVPASLNDGNELPSQPVGKRRKISTACNACQHRKTRCSGDTPCTACISRGSTCLYDATSDQRRKIAVHRNLQDLSETRATLERTRHVLSSVIAVLRAGGEQSVTDLLSLIKSGVDIPQVAAHVRNAILSDSTIQAAFDELISNANGPQELPSASTIFNRDEFFDSLPFPDMTHTRTDVQINPSTNYFKQTHHISHDPPIKVPAKPWTMVTDNDLLVSHLLSLWLTWIYPWWQWIDKDSFVEAMQQRDVSNPLCTPCIVNLILADACLLDDDDDDDDDMIANRVEMGKRFYAESVRHLNSIRGKPTSMGKISALGLQWTYLNSIGEDRLGLEVLDEQIRKAEELDQWRQNLRLAPQLLRKVDISLDRLTWTLYALKSLSLMSLKQMKPPELPYRPKPVRDCIKEKRHDHNPNQPWILYPTSTARTFHYECHYSCFLSLAETVCQAEGLLQRTTDGTNNANEKFDALFKELQSWPDILPDCMQLGEQPTPHVIALHAIYLWALINLMKQANAAAKGRLEHPELIESQPDEKSRWNSAAYNCALRISELLVMHNWLWGVNNFPIILIQPISLALFILLGNLSNPAHSRAFTNLCFWIFSISRKLRVAEGILDLVERQASERGIEIPHEAKKYFVARHVDESDAKQVDVDFLLGKWDDFDLETEE